MSAIEKELMKATDLAPKRGEDRQDFLKALNMAATKLSDAAWEKLSEEAQEWLNNCADVLNDKNAKKKVMPDFPDAEAAEEEDEPPKRRRAAAADDEPEGGKQDAPEPKLFDTVKIKTKRGKEYTGKVIEIDDEIIALDTDQEFGRDKIESIEILGAKKSRRVDDGDDEPAAPELGVGDMATATNKRGKVVTGKIIEMTDESVVIDDGEDEHEFQRERLESLVPAGGKAKTKAAEPEAEKEEPAKRRRAGAEPEKEEPAKRTRASNGTVSVGTAIRAAILDDLEATEEEIAKVLKKAGVDCKENTLSLNYNEAHKFLKQIKDKGMLKVK